MAASSTAFADQIVNGGFETGDFSGWTLTGNTGFTSVGIPANTGTHGATFGSIGSDAILSQSVSNNVAGTTYKLSFYYGSQGGIYNDFSAVVNGTTLYSVVNDEAHGYALYEFTFTSQGTDTVTFGFRDDPAYEYLDDVSVAQAPEPSSLILLGTGLLGLVGAARRRFATA